MERFHGRVLVRLAVGMAKLLSELLFVKALRI